MARPMTRSFAIICSLLSFACAKCPEDNGPPCWCVKNFGFSTSNMNCDGITSEGELRQAISRLQGYPIGMVDIVKSKIEFLPSDLFQGFKIERVFISKCQFNSLSNSDVAFNGLEDTLEFLDIYGSNLKNGWKWSHLKKLAKLKRLSVVQSGPILVDEGIKEIAHLNISTFRLTTDSLTTIHETAFSTFQNLRFLRLKDNFIAELKRSMFPNPANKLEEINLSKNRMKDFPPDLFTNMPALKVIDLEDNQIVTLQEQTFGPVWGQLRVINLQDNQFVCDCSVIWMLKRGLPSRIWGKCTGPKKLRGYKIRDVTLAHMSC